MIVVVEGGGFEPPKAPPTDLQSVPFGRSGTPPHIFPEDKRQKGDRTVARLFSGLWLPVILELAMGLEPATP